MKVKKPFPVQKSHRCNSWVVADAKTGYPLCETTNERFARKCHEDEGANVYTTAEWLGMLNTEEKEKAYYAQFKA